VSDISLPDGWKVVALGDLLTESSDLTYGVVQPGAPTPQGIPIVRVKDIRDGRVVTDDPLLISPEIERQYERSRIRGGELLVTLVGTVGETAVAADDLRGWNTARAVATVRLPTADDSRWVGFCLQSPDGKDRIGSRVNTTVQTTLNLKDLREFPVTLPPRTERQAIAGVLGALDDKIESNRRKTGLLRKLLGAIYEDHECKATEFEPLTNWANLIKGTEPGRDKCNEEKLGIPFIRVGDLIRDEAALYTTSTNCERADEDSVLVSFDGTPGRVATAMSGAFSSGIRKADPRSAQISSGLLLAALESASVQRTIAEYATGTTILHAGAAIPHIRVPLLGQSQIRELSVELENLRRGIVASTRETRLLRKVRETLLPELLSGRLRVRDAEKIVEEAV